MSFLGPFALSTWAIIAGSAALLAISAYIIKMRRRRFEVPFARLWKRVLEQKDANALWKQLKRLISLLLILFILGLVLFAALDPTLGGTSREARNVVVLIDASASMKANDGGTDDADKKTTRMQAAKTKAKELVDSMGGGDLALIMKVDGQATPMSRFTTDAPMLRKVIDQMEPSDTPADLTRALGAAADALRDRNNPLIVIISDGAFPEQQLGLVHWTQDADPKAEKNLASIDLSKIDVRFLPVGKRSDNVGIIAFNVRRYIANKAAYEVYVEIQNFGSEPAHRKLRLYNGTTVVDAKVIDLAPGERIHRIYAKLPANVDNKLRVQLAPMDGAGGSDPFPLDDEAFALLPAQKKQKVLMVTEDNLFLEGALLVYDNVDPMKVTPAEYDAKPSVADGMDAVIFDEHTPAVLPMPPTNLLFFHPTGENSPFAMRGETANPHITEIDEDHPVMRWVTMSDVFMDKSNVFAIDAKKGESALAYYVRDPIIAAKRDGKRKMLAFGFSLPSLGRDGATDLPMRVAFPMLLVNTLDWFAGDTTDLLTTYSTGQRQRVPLDGVVGATEAEVTYLGDDTGVPQPGVGVKTKTPVIDGLATFYASRVGYYDLAAKSPTGQTIAQIELAANLSSPIESDIAPSSELTLGGKKLEAPEPFAISRSQKLWIYLVLFAMGLIFVEWITYHRRITV
ncbi:MAG: VWA domain-containing protein [Kofleriaceae bacterium]